MLENQKAPLKKNRVRVDPDIQDLIPGYLENREKDLVVFRQALDKDDFEAIAALGHSMKGSGGGYGFNDLSIIGRAIENAAKNRDKDSVSKSIMEMTDFLNTLEVIYD